MEMSLKELIVPITIVASMVGSVGIVTLIIVLRDKISGVHVSRAGVEIRTNDIPVWSMIVDKIERIDSETCKAVRKATTGLMIFDPEKYDLSAEAMLVIREANQPLIYAIYENHHTRALVADADMYLEDKAQDIFRTSRILKKHFPELTEERCHALACHWLKRILLPNLRRACVEKVAYYIEQVGRNDISSTVKEILSGCRSKNEDYVRCIDKLLTRPDIAERSSIICPAHIKQRGEQ